MLTTFCTKLACCENQSVLSLVDTVDQDLDTWNPMSMSGGGERERERDVIFFYSSIILKNSINWDKEDGDTFCPKVTIIHT